MGKIKNGILVNGSKIGHATVVSDKIEKTGHVVPGLIMIPTCITIHNVGDDDVRGETWHKALHNANKYGEAGGYRTASWHVTVDYDKIYQSVSFNRVAWHAGDGREGKGNRHSIGIEHCQYSKDKEKQRKVWENSAALCVEIMRAYPAIDLAHIVQHYFWTKKDCPYLLRHKRFGYDWAWYKDLVKTTKAGTTVTDPKPPASNDTKVVTPYLVRIITASLNIRTGPGTSYTKVGEVTKGGVYTIVEENAKGTWGKLKSGAGWICITSSYVEKV